MSSWQRSRRVGGAPRRSCADTSQANGHWSEAAEWHQQECATYRRLPSGQWGLLGRPDLMIPGSQVRVKRQDGRIETQRVGRTVLMERRWVITTIAPEESVALICSDAP